MSMQSGQPKEQNKKDALDLPEILLFVSQFLSRHTLAQCLLVSRPWYLALKPLIWKEIEVKSFDTDQVPPFEDIQENSSLVRKLVVDYKLVVNPKWNLTCRFLDDLTVNGLGYSDRDSSKIYDSPLNQLIRKHGTTLRRVTIGIRVGESTLEALADCPRLESVIFTRDVKITNVARWVELYQELQPKLRTLSLPGPTVTGLETEDLSPAKIEEWHRSNRARPSRIQDLTLSAYISHENFSKLQCWMVESCRDLVRLKWNPPSFGFNDRSTWMQGLAHIVQAGHHSKLEDVNMSYTSFNDEDLSKLVQSIRRLTRLDLSWTNFEPSSWAKIEAVPRHLETLVYLNVEICHGMRGFAIQRMLCSLPNLKSFHADGLSETDLENDPRPWVCQGLEHFSVTLEVVSGNLSSKMALEFLSRVNQLRKLKSWDNFFPVDSEGSQLKWKVWGGLDQLKDLRVLESVDDSIKKKFGHKELQWILDHWPNLVQPSRQVLEKRVRDLKITAAKKR